jgi:hypothetical protein
MPCRSEYQEPTQVEIETQRVAGFLIYLEKVCDPAFTIPNHILREVNDALKHPENNTQWLDSFTAILCSGIRSLDTSMLDKALYDGKIKKARQLADWWEKHQEWDKKCEAKTESFRKALAGLINKHSLEIGSNTPDYVLADYLIGCLQAFENAVKARGK